MHIPRMTAWFGDGAYSYNGILHLPALFPAIIERLRERAEVLSGASFNAALANLYRTGRDSVGWHSDNEAGLGNRPIIASLSLGGERRFQFRHRETKQTITLGLRMGHWLIMAGETALLGSSSAEDGRSRSAAGQSQFQTPGPVASVVKTRTGA